MSKARALAYFFIVTTLSLAYVASKAAHEAISSLLVMRLH
ncbi:hypothetical protein [Ralstonia phage P-PSG-11-1]|uniref:Uncharacterized protein n=1 Tax=Ralstonia phage P-PSG-11 TaxID=2652430 RepID=A0A5P8D5M3_9CAUD|nr:hypothetical protein [Ralstonia phage P-PSG-11]QFP93740.1 hypothetical protein [Ralstonia phage P-PSG-11-1]